MVPGWHSGFDDNRTHDQSRSPVQIIGSTVTLTAKISGTQISGVTVSFYADLTLIGAALTDESMQSSFSYVTAPLNEGQHTFRAEFPDVVTATRLLGVHNPIFVNGVFIGYFDVYERDRATASSGDLLQQFVGVSLSSLRWMADASFQFSFDAKAGWNYPILVSTNLADCIVLTNLPPSGGLNLVVDAQASK